MMRPVAVLVVSDVFVNLPSSCPSQKILYCFQKRENEFRFETLQNIFKMSIQAVDSWQVIIVCLCCGDDWAIHNNSFHLNQTKQTLTGIPLFHSYPAQLHLGRPVFSMSFFSFACFKSFCVLLALLLWICTNVLYCWRCSYHFVCWKTESLSEEVKDKRFRRHFKWRKKTSFSPKSTITEN